MFRDSLRRALDVFPYGSVPLKTFLPDGDIDLTAISCPNIEDSLVSDVHAVLRGEEHNEAAPYEVKDVHCIDAEVRILKCIVQNIVVDISFNQLGGLCTLCFLEQVDRLVGKDHLFKRSIILIKAWCYYESRILGAHHGLISTYALETLVLYIFHLFHSSLNGPLAVLYKFLDYFSKFDWEKYCISLNGPVCRSSLPEIRAEIPENGGDHLLLSEEFLRNCVEMFPVLPRGLETNSRPFPQKHLNIIDPLKENNNLGRSVNRGNFYRIRGALKYGARKLGWILLLPRERIGNELKMFFSNTLDRHGSNCWTDIQNPSLASGAIGSDFSSLSLQPIVCSKDTVFLKSTFDFHDEKISGIEVNSGVGPKGYSQKVVSSEPLPELDCIVDRNAIIGCCFAGDASSGILSMRTNCSSYCLHSESNSRTLFLRDSHHATHFNSSGYFQKNGKIDNFNPCQNMPANSVVNDEMVSTLWPEVKEKHLADSNLVCSCINQTGMASTCSVVSNSVANVSPCNGERYITGVPGSTEALKCLLDLSGDYDSHLRNLQYAQLCHGYAVSLHLLPMPPMSLKLQNGHSQMSKNGGVVLGPPFYSYPTSSCSAYGLEEKKKPRGTGTYFPKLYCRPYRDTPVPEQGRNHAMEVHGQLQRDTHNNGLTPGSRQVNLSDEGNLELSHDEFPVLGRRKSGSSDSHQSPLSHANGYPRPSDKLESGSPSGISHTWDSAPCPVAPAVQSLNNPLPLNNQERVEAQLYHLKDEDDFPPLCH
ncbi:uncharacterized protein LOC132163720 isoform X2 [Corylus avellana]|uniref:uncharacterized protein LOC132163720 isoform X2 n=1 Tax=Corylus avellana TaxID=13451 RepID=UPI00286CF7D8|nr:uncharacterized protein LOC132163720 isoform X2 [Corylus avellana]